MSATSSQSDKHLIISKKVTDVIRMADAHNAGIRGYDCEYSPAVSAQR